MSVIQSVLKEEFDRLKSLKEKYQSELAGFPKGAVSKRKRGSQVYLYLIYRKGEKVITEYIGKWDSDTSQIIRQRVAERKEQESKLKRVNKDLLEVERALRG
jgi:hypothetical protein